MKTYQKIKKTSFTCTNKMCENCPFPDCILTDKEAEIMQMIEQYDSTLLEHAKQFLGLPMRVLTAEEIEKLNAKAATLANEITEYSKKTFEDILLDDLANLKL